MTDRSGTSRTLLPPTENIIKLKVVLIGDMNVGKTSLAVRFTRDKFEESYKQTIGAAFISKVAIVHGDVVSFQIWDTAGQERYRSLVPMYLRGAHIAFIIYDVTDPMSFTNVSFWLDALQHHGDMATTVLVANKCDLQSVVEDTVALNFAQDNGLQFVTTSAKTGYNVEQLFHSIGGKVVAAMRKETMAYVKTCHRRPPSTGSDTINLSTESESEDSVKKGRRRCCRSH